MRRKQCLLAAVILAATAAAGWAGTFGRVVPISGHAADLALDAARGAVYLANFTASQIDVISTATLTRRSAMAVAAQPSSLALSPDGKYLLVTHNANFAAPATAFHGLTIIRLDTGVRQTVALPSPPLGVAFTSDNRALVVTASEFLRYEPSSGALAVLTTFEELETNSLPTKPANRPTQVTAASVAASRDGEHIYGLTDTIYFRFDRHPQRVTLIGYVSDPTMGPRAVSVSRDGAYFAAGWAVFDRRGSLTAQSPGASGLLETGGHAIDSDRGLIFAQIPKEKGEAPVLMVADADNLTVRERLRLPENLAGKAVLSDDGATMYAISASGLAVLPVGAWQTQRRLTSTAESVFFQSQFCTPAAPAQEVFLVDGAGGAIDYAITGGGAGLTVAPTSGTTPAAIQLKIDPNALANRQGTIVYTLTVTSSQAVNLPLTVRVLVNLRQPDQRGTVFHVPGDLVDVLADPVRNQFYILRQDANQVLVYDGGDYSLLKTLRTGTTPTQMSFTLDGRYLLVGNNNSQIASVFDLETLEPDSPIRFPFGHYPRSLAPSGRTMLAATRVAGTPHVIDRVNFAMRTAEEPASLGVWENDVNEDTVLFAPPGGASITAAGADGSLLLYDVTADAITIWNKDYESLGGPYAASPYEFFVVNDQLLNSSLVAMGSLDTSGGTASGFALTDLTGFLTIAPTGEGPGLIQRYDFSRGIAHPPTRMAEAPRTAGSGSRFMRTLAAVAGGNVLVALTASGFTVLSANYDAATAPPAISQVVNAADFTAPVASGGLFALFGSRLSPVNAATSEMPLPRALGESCLLANGAPVPMLFVSPGQINAQMPYEVSGIVTLVLHTPGGVSDSFRMTVASAAPSVFRSGTAGPLAGLPTILRAANDQLVTNANPVHRGDTLVIYLTGLGATSPAVQSGAAAPSAPLAWAAEPPLVTLGGVPLSVAYAGLTPGLVGVYQINVRVPESVPAGMSIPLSIAQGTGETALPVRVVQ